MGILINILKIIIGGPISPSINSEKKHQQTLQSKKEQQKKQDNTVPKS